MLFKKLLLLILGTLASLAAAELWIRSWSPVELGFHYQDGSFLRAREFEHDTARNRLGFHDVEPTPGERGSYRIILLGDSYVAALSVPIEQTVGQRLEHHLDQQGAGRFDVVSLGGVGWGQGQEWEALRKWGAELDPDLVITLFLPLNDVRNNSAVLEERGREQALRMQRFRPGWTRLRREDAPFFWIESSLLNRLVSHRIAELRSRFTDPEVPVDYRVYATRTDPLWEEAWRNTEALVLRTRALSRSLGASYALVSTSTPQGVYGAEAGLRMMMRSYPAMKGGSWDLDGPNRRIRRHCQANRIPFLSLEREFRRITQREGRQLHWRLDGHWNAEGNDRAGKSIAAFVRALLNRNR